MNAWCIVCDIFNMCQLIKSNSIRCDASSPDLTLNLSVSRIEHDRPLLVCHPTWWHCPTCTKILKNIEMYCRTISPLLQSSWYSHSLDYSMDSLLDTYPVVPAWSLLPQRWFSPGQPRTSHPARRCLPGPCRSVHPTPLEPCRSQSHRWRRSAAWSDHRPPYLQSSCSDQSLPPTGWTGRFINKKYYWFCHQCMTWDFPLVQNLM